MSWNNDLHKKGSVLLRRIQHFDRRVRVHQAQRGRSYNNRCLRPTPEFHTSNGTPDLEHLGTPHSWRPQGPQLVLVLKTNKRHGRSGGTLPRQRTLASQRWQSNAQQRRVQRMLDFHLGNRSIAKKWTGFTVGQRISDHHCTISSFGLMEVKPQQTKINWMKYRKEALMKMEIMSLAGREALKTKNEVK